MRATEIEPANTGALNRRGFHAPTGGYYVSVSRRYRQALSEGCLTNTGNADHARQPSPFTTDLVLEGAKT